MNDEQFYLLRKNSIAIVPSNLILFGYNDGRFFDNQYDDEDEFNEAIQKFKKAAGLGSNTLFHKFCSDSESKLK